MPPSLFFWPKQELLDSILVVFSNLNDPMILCVFNPSQCVILCHDLLRYPQRVALCVGSPWGGLGCVVCWFLSCFPPYLLYFFIFIKHFSLISFAEGDRTCSSSRLPCWLRSNF